ncbi:MAG: RNA polymerase sigma factor [Lacipirellulaceae bacterium]
MLSSLDTATDTATTRPAAPGMVDSGVMDTDGELLRRFTRHGETAALETLLERHGAMVWRVCRQALRRPQDAEDAYQATFLLLVRGASRIGASESAAGWLFRVARRTSLRARKRLAARREEGLAVDPAAPPERKFPDLWRRELASVLAEELDRLPDRYRTPLVMRYLEGQSRRAIAEATDTTTQGVQGRLARGKQLLRSRLIRRGVTLATAIAAVTSRQSEAMAATAPSHVVLQTASNASALATGGALSASAGVVALLHQGTRAMLATTLAKPLAVAACGLAAFALLANAAGPTPAPDGRVVAGVLAPDGRVVLTAEVADEPADPSRVPLNLAATDQEPEASAPRADAALDSASEWRPGDENSIERLTLHQHRLRGAIAVLESMPDDASIMKSDEAARLVGAYERVVNRLASLIAPADYVDSVLASAPEDALAEASTQPVEDSESKPAPPTIDEIAPLLEEARATIRRMAVIAKQVNAMAEQHGSRNDPLSVAISESTGEMQKEAEVRLARASAVIATRAKQFAKEGVAHGESTTAVKKRLREIQSDLGHASAEIERLRTLSTLLHASVLHGRVTDGASEFDIDLFNVETLKTEPPKVSEREVENVLNFLIDAPDGPRLGRDDASWWMDRVRLDGPRIKSLNETISKNRDAAAEVVWERWRDHDPENRDREVTILRKVLAADPEIQSKR